MCGIAGILNLDRASSPPDEAVMRQMLAMIRHRGPDEFGIYLDERIGLGSARLGIIDLAGGQQPISNEDESLWIVFNGEIFNYLELRAELVTRGHRFTTNSDTEVLLHLFEEHGPACLQRLNGQFAFAIWNSRERSLFLARDRLGVRPLFYTRQGGRLLIASEIKALLATGWLSAEMDPTVMAEVFTYWSALSPRTLFKNVHELPPGHYLEASQDQLTIKKYWEPEFPESPEVPALSARSAAARMEELGELLVDAVKVRLRADVPVGAYLSGGLDSSLIAAIVRNTTSNRLDTFSITFDDGTYDESAWQLQMAKHLGTDHQVVHATQQDIGQIFPEVIWHAETPVMRTAPAPMFLLSRLVRSHGFKVVLTGEGADEFLGGYDIFKEAKIRRFWATNPDSSWRALLLQRLYPDIAQLGRTSSAMLSAFFRENLSAVSAPDYSHVIRWRNGRRNCRFLRKEVQREIAQQDRAARLAEMLPARFTAWEPLARAQYLEIKTFLSSYLLSSQGDRMGMANSIEGRFPFLDFRVVEYCNRLPARLKLRALTEKYLLKQLGRKWLPPEIWRRRKRPYRAPIHRCFLGAARPEYMDEILSPTAIACAGFFDAALVAQLERKLTEGQSASEADEMALVGIISAQLLHHQFSSRVRVVKTLTAEDDVKVCRGRISLNVQ